MAMALVAQKRPASGALTLEAWIRPASVDSDDEQLIFALGSSEPGVDDCYHTYDLRLVALGELLPRAGHARDEEAVDFRRGGVGHGEEDQLEAYRPHRQAELAGWSSLSACPRPPPLLSC